MSHTIIVRNVPKSALTTMEILVNIFNLNEEERSDMVRACFLIGLAEFGRMAQDEIQKLMSQPDEAGTNDSEKESS